MNSTPTAAEVTRELLAAHDLFSSLVAKLEEDAASLKRSLSIAVLDGMPYAAVLIHEGRELVAGCFRQLDSGAFVDGFLDFEAIPVGLSGAYLWDLNGVSKTIDRLNAKGGRAVAIHRRELERRQLERTERNLRSFRENLLAIEARLGTVKNPIA